MISVLYVDDDSDLLDTGKSYLEQTQEFAVVTASSGSAALELIRSNGIQAIVSDYQMPDMDGIALLQQIRAMNNNIPFIMFTGKGREEIAVKSFENGADFYLQKGGDPESLFAELMHKIKVAVEHRQADAQVTAVNRLYAVLSATNKAILHFHDKSKLLDEICRIVVADGGITMAWAGFVNEEKHLIKNVGTSGRIDGVPDAIALSTDDAPAGKNPTETAFHTGTVYVCNDIKSDPAIAPWQKEALGRGYRSLAAFPFALNTRNAGVITYYASKPGFFNDRIIRLLEDQSGDISFALETLDHEEQRTAAKHELEESELRYRRLFEAAQDAILILDGETGEIIDANKFILDMMGYPLEYFVGKNLWELGFLKNKSFAIETFTKLKTEGYIRYEDLPMETRQGKAISVEFVSNVYLVGDKRIIQCNIRNVTERKRAEDALALASRKLSLMSTITRHDIMNQLMVLSGSLDLAQKSAKEPQRTVHMNRAKKAANTIQRQIEFTKEYEDLGSKAPAWQSLSGVVHSAESQLAPNPIILEISDDSLEIYADTLLEKVFYNLFDNTRKYGGAVTRISISHHPAVSGLIITIADNGIGISVEDKQRLFERGFGKNTGLGLFLSQEILSITGISISETGTPGKGAQFEILVPEEAFRFKKEPAPS
ncbi:multi-sensor signal transduction histidine kinase [Methanoregula boonei 6A8]|jgi:PAS domain S-box-containing protein|uniref:Multi-sensor signal transduction histidine kinase n=1 Tax=Methanoregula boonei (strain DSM 21154 / JCM 14090 / 6A8) TaxID=456442 RepID=A7I8D9_METB6|nr:response regulator [Methanoregula boonei]ABS56000.1 multi-sensor signal transduction histidine kinase [Methanoregula boonei 6A8]